ncbi:hypothetical protein H5410_036384 [Solanum commersonii]|uniref:Gag-pol polyprotein n=1 Tax=Solanum commersonii TaxID=4109 RepID=A0A9J5Y6C5_SOLCO|nr:hypothetical protein H5410_036384 [Solanum commersonii]
MNTTDFTVSSVTEGLEEFVEELYKVFEVMHVANSERVELGSFQLKAGSGRQLRYREECHNKKAKTTCNEPGQQKANNLNRSSFQQRSTGPASSSASAPTPKNIKGHFIRECHTNMKGNSNGAIEPNLLQQLRETKLDLEELLLGWVEEQIVCVLTSRQEQENSPDIVTMIKFFTFDVYVLLDAGASPYFMTPYIAMRLDILLERLLDPLSVSTPICNYSS